MCAITKEKQDTNPSNEMFRRDELDKELIIVSSTLAKGKHKKRGVKIESRWRVNRELRTMSFVSGLLVTRLREELLMPSEIPDRHIRTIRRLGSKEFGVKPFRGLRLYTPVNDEPLILASRTSTLELKDNGDDETGTRLFIQMEDVQLWSIVCDSEHSVSTTTPQDFKRNTGDKRTVPEVIRWTNENSLSVRYEYAQLIEQAMSGLAAIRRILTLRNRGLNQRLLDFVWSSVHGGSGSILRFDFFLKTLNDLLRE